MHKLTIDKGGERKLNHAPYELYGLRLFDKVAYLGEIGFIFGRRRRGIFDVRRLDNTRIKEVSYKKLQLLQKRKTYLKKLERRRRFLTRVSSEVPAPNFGWNNKEIYF